MTGAHSTKSKFVDECIIYFLYNIIQKLPKPIKCDVHASYSRPPTYGNWIQLLTAEYMYDVLVHKHICKLHIQRTFINVCFVLVYNWRWPSIMYNVLHTLYICTITYIQYTKRFKYAYTLWQHIYLNIYTYVYRSKVFDMHAKYGTVHGKYISMPNSL